MITFIKIIYSDDSEKLYKLESDSVEELQSRIEYISMYPGVTRVEILNQN